MSDPKVLVTGGAGYVGSHACKALAAAGFEPVTYDNLVSGHRWAVRWGPLETGDIRDQFRLERVIARHEPVAVMHFAAAAYVGESVRDPAKYYHNNVVGTLALLEAMRSQGIATIVFSSTCAIYGMPETLPIRESQTQSPINPYGASKLFVERMLRDFDDAYAIKHASLRYFNAAGADSDGEIGELHQPETHLIPLVLQAALGQRERVQVYGADYDTPDGTAIRDFVHVNDLATAHVRAVKRLLAGGSSFAVNLGTGRGYSVREVIASVERMTGASLRVDLAPRRPGDPAMLVADPGLARELLGWQSRSSDMDQIIASAWRWHRDRLEAEIGPIAVG